MKLTAKFGLAVNWDAAWAAVLFLMLALSVAALDRAPASSRVSHHGDTRRGLSVTGRAVNSASNDFPKVRNYFMDLAGDHSLDVATVIEQSSPGYTKYTVQLHLASGVEQSVVVAAPPGGLQIEMHDMTG